MGGSHIGGQSVAIPADVAEPVAAEGRAAIAVAVGSAIRASAKRGLDIAVSATLLALLLPVIAVTALVVILESRGPALYRAERVGYRGSTFRLLKFRKMRRDAAGSPLTVAGDERLTRVGAWLCETRLDELPQLWQVLRGRLSLVGPRPEDPGFVSIYARDYDEILTVRPGLTGLSQLAFAREGQILLEDAPVEHYVGTILPQKIRLDRMYAAQRGLLLDLRILLWTLAVLLLKWDVAVHRETGKLTLRRRARRETSPPLEPEPLPWANAQ